MSRDMYKPPATSPQKTTCLKVTSSEEDVLKALDGLSITHSRKSSSSSSASESQSHSPAPDAMSALKNAVQGSAKSSICPLDPRHAVFKPSIMRPSASNHVNHLERGSQTQKDTSVFGVISGLPDTRTSISAITATPHSQRSCSALTPSSTSASVSGWSSSSNTLYSPTTRRKSHPDDIRFEDKQRASSSFANGSTPRNFAQEEPGRYLLLSNVPTTTSGTQLQSLISEIAPYRGIVVKHLQTNGWVIVAFWDSRDAVTVYDKLTSSAVRFSSSDSAVQLHCSSLSYEATRQLVGPGEEWESLWVQTESTLRIQVYSTLGVDAKGLEEYLADLGDLKSFEAHDNTGHVKLQYNSPAYKKVFTADFYDTRVAAEIIKLLHNQYLNGGTFLVTYLCDDPFLGQATTTPRSIAKQQSYYNLGAAAASKGLLGRSLSLSAQSDRHVDLLNQNSPSTALIARRSTLSRLPPTSLPTHTRRASASTDGWTTWNGNGTPRADDRSNASAVALNSPVDSHFAEPTALQSILDQMDVSARARQRHAPLGHGSVSAPITPTSTTHAYASWPQYDRQAIPPENRVFPERILAGLDTRTTVMVKDVPNKLSRQELVNILHEVVPGEFDFVYLRFDFNNHCNVGYAFVNFTSTKALYKFYQARVGKKWNMFSSEKVLQVSYANIQGKVALVNKFRNSSVMDVIEEWRPQIFYGALQGQPEPFPESDNPARGHRTTSTRLSFLSGSTPPEHGYDYSSAPTSYGF